MARLVESAPSSQPSVAVAIPAYNEADGIGGFLEEIDRALSPHVRSLALIVIDDASSDDTGRVLGEVAPRLSGTLEVIRNAENRGHGPSVLEAYRRALRWRPDYVLQVDGDGQFLGSDLRRVLVLLLDEAHAVCGVRRFRQDPWFRMIMTRLVRSYMNFSFGVGARDPNCPLRGYESAMLQDLLSALPGDCLVPNLYLTVVASRRGLALVEVDVSHRVRRGGSAEGTTWKQGTRSPVPWRLVRFSLAALLETRSFRASLDA
ncbi:MAG: glycosyltransferase family 2 protein [Actinomycetota bacterium]|nr:glycosyltransferase family 2 protein [Actinomycetota bacterium]